VVVPRWMRDGVELMLRLKSERSRFSDMSMHKPWHAGQVMQEAPSRIYFEVYDDLNDVFDFNGRRALRDIRRASYACFGYVRRSGGNKGVFEATFVKTVGVLEARLINVVFVHPVAQLY
jgi:hypothetical protein